MNLINIGVFADDLTGDEPKEAAEKINENLSCEFYGMYPVYDVKHTHITFPFVTPADRHGYVTVIHDSPAFIEDFIEIDTVAVLNVNSFGTQIWTRVLPAGVTVNCNSPQFVVSAVFVNWRKEPTIDHVYESCKANKETTLLTCPTNKIISFGDTSLSTYVNYYSSSPNIEFKLNGVSLDQTIFGVMKAGDLLTVTYPTDAQIMFSYRIFPADGTNDGKAGLPNEPDLSQP